MTDRGAGLSSAEQARLGERFFRGARTATTTTGSGLGVWIASAFLRANDGSLAVASEGEGHGTTRDNAPARAADAPPARSFPMNEHAPVILDRRR